uniref:Thioredoxin-like protein 4B n=1 Tax=Leersia perrieri TaxID=77586 RepID=A0A0D9XRF4_9ORYZ
MGHVTGPYFLLSPPRPLSRIHGLRPRRRRPHAEGGEKKKTYRFRRGRRRGNPMGSVVLPTLRRKQEVDAAIRDTLDKVLVLRFGSAADAACLHLDDILAKSSWDISKFGTVALVDMDSEEMQVYIDYFDITLVPATIFFFNAHHMKMDSGTPDHTKWIGSFSSKQDFIDVVEAIFRGAMKGKMIVSCPLPPERIPRFQLLFKDITGLCSDR